MLVMLVCGSLCNQLDATNSNCGFQVTAHLDDTAKFTDRIVITVEGGQYSVALIATGVGSTLVCEALANGTLHFGTQLSYSVVTKPFEIDNKGRFIQNISWERDPEVKKNFKSVFAFTPAKMGIGPHTLFTFTVTGKNQTCCVHIGFSWTVASLD